MMSLMMSAVVLIRSIATDTNADSGFSRSHRSTVSLNAASFQSPLRGRAALRRPDASSRTDAAKRSSSIVCFMSSPLMTLMCVRAISVVRRAALFFPASRKAGVWLVGEFPWAHGCTVRGPGYCVHSNTLELVP